MSKSLGNGIDPLEMADKFGADALRFNLITGNSPGNDMRFYVEKCEAMRNFCNKIWNASRFVMMNLSITENRLPEKLETEDKWILSKLNRTAVRYTQTTPEEAAKADCLIIDCFGLLSSIYSCAKVTYVGGGFGVGIHNVLEAAVWNVPVIFGPNNKRFQEAQELLATQGGMEINSYEDFERIMDRFDSDAEYLSISSDLAGAYVKTKAGAADKVIKGVGL